MAKTKFYLGYETNNNLTSLSILDNNMELVGSELTDVINYTTLFENESELRNAIINGPMPVNIPEDAKIVYLAATNNPSMPFKKVLDSDHICYSSSTSLLEPDSQENYLIENRFDENLVTNLYAVIIRCLVDINYIKKFYPKDAIDNNETLVKTFRNNKDKIYNSNNYIFSFVEDIYLQCLEANRRGIDNYLNDSDRLDLEYLIKRLYDTVTIKKDKKGNIKYNPNNGKKERYSRIIGYLGILISDDMLKKYQRYTEDDYEEYAKFVEEELAKEAQEKDNNYKTDVYNDLSDSEEHDEEFLTSDDFEAYGEDPESNGYKLRGNA